MMTFWATALGVGLLAASPSTQPTTRPSILERLSPARLARFDQDRRDWVARVQAVEVPYPFARGVFHIHSRLSHDSRGSVAEIVAAARATGTRIVGFGEHPSREVDVIARNVRGWQDGVFFLPGTESNNTLYWPGPDGRGDLRFVCHPEEVPRIERARFNGMEIYNTHVDAKDEPTRKLVAAMILNLPAVRAHPEAAFASFFDYPREFLARFDQLTLEGPFAGIGANDSHQNQGIKLIAMPDGTVEAQDATQDTVWKGEGYTAVMLRTAFGHPVVPDQPVVLTECLLDPYAISMRHVGTFLQVGEVTEETIREALRTGRIVIGFEIIAPLPFVGFWVDQDRKPVGTVGDQVPWKPGLTLRWALPLPAEVRLYCDGRPVQESVGNTGQIKDVRAGVYRLEAFLKLAGERWPWVLTNPVYIARAGGERVPAEVR